MDKLITSTNGQTEAVNFDDSRNNVQHKHFFGIYVGVAVHCTIFFFFFCNS